MRTLFEIPLGLSCEPDQLIIDDSEYMVCASGSSVYVYVDGVQKEQLGGDDHEEKKEKIQALALSRYGWLVSATSSYVRVDPRLVVDLLHRGTSRRRRLRGNSSSGSGSDVEKEMEIEKGGWRAPSTDSQIRCLSWSSTGMAFVSGGWELILWKIDPSIPGLCPCWRRAMASRVQICSFSPDDRYFLSNCEHSRVVQVWYASQDGIRLSFPLAHPRAVTSAMWNSNAEFDARWRPHSLVTLARDGIIRVWMESGRNESVGFSIAQSFDPSPSPPAMLVSWITPSKRFKALSNLSRFDVVDAGHQTSDKVTFSSDRDSISWIFMVSSDGTVSVYLVDALFERPRRTPRILLWMRLPEVMCPRTTFVRCIGRTCGETVFSELSGFQITAVRSGFLEQYSVKTSVSSEDQSLMRTNDIPVFSPLRIFSLGSDPAQDILRHPTHPFIALIGKSSISVVFTGSVLGETMSRSPYVAGSISSSVKSPVVCGWFPRDPILVYLDSANRLRLIRFETNLGFSSSLGGQTRNAATDVVVSDACIRTNILKLDEQVLSVEKQNSFSSNGLKANSTGFDTSVVETFSLFRPSLSRSLLWNSLIPAIQINHSSFSSCLSGEDPYFSLFCFDDPCKKDFVKIALISFEPFTVFVISVNFNSGDICLEGTIGYDSDHPDGGNSSIDIEPKFSSPPSHPRKIVSCCWNGVSCLLLSDTGLFFALIPASSGVEDELRSSSGQQSRFPLELKLAFDSDSSSLPLNILKDLNATAIGSAISTDHIDFISNRPVISDTFSNDGNAARDLFSSDALSDDRNAARDLFSSNSFSNDRNAARDLFSSDRNAARDLFSSDSFSNDRNAARDLFSSDALSNDRNAARDLFSSDSFSNDRNAARDLFRSSSASSSRSIVLPPAVSLRRKDIAGMQLNKGYLLIEFASGQERIVLFDIERSYPHMLKIDEFSPSLTTRKSLLLSSTLSEGAGRNMILALSEEGHVNVLLEDSLSWKSVASFTLPTSCTTFSYCSEGFRVVAYNLSDRLSFSINEVSDFDESLSRVFFTPFSMSWYHPQFLYDCLLTGRKEIVEQVVEHLYETLIQAGNSSLQFFCAPPLKTLIFDSVHVNYVDSDTDPVALESDSRKRGEVSLKPSSNPKQDDKLSLFAIDSGFSSRSLLEETSLQLTFDDDYNFDDDNIGQSDSSSQSFSRLQTKGTRKNPVSSSLSQSSSLDGSISSKVESILECLVYVQLPQLSSYEQTHLHAILDSYLHVAEHPGALDQPAVNFLVAARYHRYLFRQHIIQGDVPFAHCCWALLSETQDALLSFLVPESGGDSTWNDLQLFGIGFWFTQVGNLKRIAENIAKKQFKDSRDPLNSALFYMALGKPNVLAALFRTAGNQKFFEFFSRDFSDPANISAATKNALHLRGQHKFQLACAFLILAGKFDDAISVLFSDSSDPLGDGTLQLALFVVTLLKESYPVRINTEAMFSKYFIPRAQGNHWLLFLFQWRLKQYDVAIDIIMSIPISDMHFGPVYSSFLRHLSVRPFLFFSSEKKRSILDVEKSVSQHLRRVRELPLLVNLLVENWSTSSESDRVSERTNAVYGSCMDYTSLLITDCVFAMLFENFSHLRQSAELFKKAVDQIRSDLSFCTDSLGIKNSYLASSLSQAFYADGALLPLSLLSVSNIIADSVPRLISGCFSELLERLPSPLSGDFTAFPQELLQRIRLIEQSFLTLIQSLGQASVCGMPPVSLQMLLFILILRFLHALSRSAFGEMQAVLAILFRLRTEDAEEIKHLSVESLYIRLGEEIEMRTKEIDNDLELRVQRILHQRNQERKENRSKLRARQRDKWSALAAANLDHSSSKGESSSISSDHAQAESYEDDRFDDSSLFIRNQVREHILSEMTPEEFRCRRLVNALSVADLVAELLFVIRHSQKCEVLETDLDKLEPFFSSSLIQLAYCAGTLLDEEISNFDSIQSIVFDGRAATRFGSPASRSSSKSGASLESGKLARSMQFGVFSHNIFSEIVDGGIPARDVLPLLFSAATDMNDRNSFYDFLSTAESSEALRRSDEFCGIAPSALESNVAQSRRPVSASSRSLLDQTFFSPSSAPALLKNLSDALLQEKLKDECFGESVFLLRDLSSRGVKYVKSKAKLAPRTAKDTNPFSPSSTSSGYSLAGSQAFVRQKPQLLAFSRMVESNPEECRSELLASSTSMMSLNGSSSMVFTPGFARVSSSPEPSSISLYLTHPMEISRFKHFVGRIVINRSDEDLIAVSTSKGVQDISLSYSLKHRRRSASFAHLLDDEFSSWDAAAEHLGLDDSFLFGNSSSPRGILAQLRAGTSSFIEILSQSMHLDMEGQKAVDNILTHDILVRSMDSHPDLPLYLTGLYDGRVVLWRFGVRQPLAVFDTQHGAVVHSVCFSPQGFKFAAVDATGRLYLWRLEPQAESHLPFLTIRVHSDVATDVAFLSDGHILGTIGSDSNGEKSFCIWDTLLPSFENCVARVPLTTGGEPSSLLFFPREGKAVIGCKKGYIRILDLRGYRSGHSSSGIPAFMPPERSHEQNVKSLCRGPVVEGIPTFLSGSSDGSVKLWLLSECKLLASLEHVHPRQTVFGAPGKMISSYGCTSVVASSDGRFIFSSGADGRVVRHIVSTVEPF